MAFSGVRSMLSSIAGSGGTRRPAAEAHGDNFLPQDSVVISDRTRHANKLGEGSFAKVYKGEYNGKPCAVKVFKEDKKVKRESSSDSGGTSEVEMLFKVQHTNIVKMYGMWLDPHKDRAAPSIVMEVCDESLYDFIRRYAGKIVLKEKKLPVLQDIARGMVYLHGQNVVHGDLRSSNVLLCHSEDQTVAKIADFDMARFLDPDTQHHLTVKFTAENYLPPEVFDHKEHKDQKKKWARLTPKVDVFCFGEVVLEMGCGTYPTPTGKFRGQETLTEQQRREKYLVKLKQSDKESLGSIIRKCLADAPEGRPDFTEILLDIEGQLNKYGERPDLDKLQDKTAECEALRAEAVKWEEDAKSLCSAQDKVEMLQDEVDRVKEEKQDLLISLGVLETELEKVKRQNDVSTGELKEALEKCHVITGEKNTLQSQLQDAKEELDAKAQHLGTRDAELKMLNGKLVDSESNWKALQNDYKKAMSEKDRLTRELTQVQDENKELKTAADKELVKAKKERDALRKDVEAGHEALTKKTNEHAKASSKLTTLEEALEQKSSKSNEQETVIQELNRTLLNMKQEVEQLKEERDTLKTSLKTSDANAVSVAEHRDQVQKKLQDKESANAKLLQSLKAKENEMKIMKQQRTKADSSAKGKDDRITKLQNKASAMDVQLKRERQEWASERNALTKLKSTAENKASAMDVQLKRERQEWASERNALTKLKGTAENKTSAMEEELKRLQNEWDSERTALQLEVATGKDHAKTLKTQLETTQSSITATVAQLEQAASAKVDKEAELHQLQETCKHLKQEHLKALEEKIEALSSVKAELQAEKDKVHTMALQKEKEHKKELDDTVKTFESAMETLQKELADNTEHSKTCESERDHLREERTEWLKVEADLKDSVKKLEKTCAEMEQSRMDLQTQLQKLKAENEAARTQQSADSQKISRLQVELQTEKGKTEETVHQKEKEVKKFKADLEAEKETVHTMEKAKLQKEKELEQYKTEIKTLKAKKRHQENALMAELQEKLHQAEDVKVKLLEEKEDHKKQEAALHDNVKEREQQYSDLMSKLKECEHQRHSLQSEKADLLLMNQKLELHVQQQAEEREKALKESEEHSMQYQDVERKLHRLSSNHAKKMAESANEIQSLKDQLARKEQLTVQALDKKEEASEEHHMDKEAITRLQKEILQLKRQLDDENDEKKKLMAQYRSQESVLRQSVEQKQSELSALVAERASLDAQLVTVNKEKSALLAAELELTREMEEAQRELKKMTVIAEKGAEEKDKEFKKCQQLQEELKTLREGKEQAKRHSKDLRLQITELQRESENVRKQFLQAQGQLAAQALASEASAHAFNEMKKSVEIAEQRQADQRTTIRRQWLDLQKRLEEKEALEERIHELEDKLEKTSKELSSVQKAHAEKEVQSATLDSAKRQSEADLHDKMEQLLLAQKRVDELDERLQNMAKEKDKAMKQATMAEKHNAQMEEALRNVSTQLEEMTKQRELVQISCKAELDKKSSKAEELQAKCSELENSLDDEKARMNDMSLSLAALSADKSDLEERLAKEEVAKNTLEEEAMKRQAELQRLYGSEEANRRTIQDLGDMLQKAEHVEELKNQLQTDCEHLNGVIAAQKRVIEGQVTELGNCKASMADMRHSIEALSADKKILEESLANEKHLRDEEVTKLTEECKQLKSAFEAQRQRLLNQLDEKSRLKSEADASNEALQNQVTTLEGDLQREKDELVKTRLHCERVEVKLHDTETELAGKVKENYAMEDGQLQLISESKELQEQLASLQDAWSQLLAEKANLQSKLDEAQKELESLQATIVKKEAELSILRKALEQKMERSLEVEEENRRLRDNQMDQKKIKRQRQMLKQGQAEVQKMLQEVKEEKVKQKLEHTSEEQFKKAVETLRTANQEERVELAQTVERTAEKALSTLAAENQKYVNAESRQLQSVMSQVKEDLTAHATELEHTSQETFKTAVETLQTASQEERVELAQKVERTTEKALSTLTAASQRNVEAESRQLQSFMSQVKEDLTAHATELEHTSQETFKTAVQTLQSVRKEETTEMAQALQKAVHDHTTTTSEELAGTVSKTLASFISKAKKLHVLSAAEKGEMLSKVWLLVQDLLRYNLLATFSPSNYLHSDSGQLVLAKKELERVCDTDTISPVCIRDLKAALEALPTALEKFAHTDFQGVVCLAIPYVTFTNKVRLYRMCFCHTPAGFDDKGHLHSKTVVVIAHVVLKPSISCKLKACVEGLVYSPIWHCGHSEELQSCFTERKLLPELVPVLQQLELATTIEVKKLLGSCSRELIKYVP